MPHDSERPAQAVGDASPGGGPGELGLIDSLVQSSFLIQAVMRRAARRHDLSIAQVRLLGILRDREPGIVALARYLSLDKSSVTGLVDRAQRRGLVERIARPEDGRAIRVALTPAGHSLAARFAEEVGEELLAVTAGLTDLRRRQLSSLLSQVVLEERGSRVGSQRG
jgi:MarR family transcriptional regulator, lower aerobic nicotinate degradation pathway regulator